MSINTKDIAKLRKMTNVGLLECKKALEKAGGDIEKAVEEMRKTGLAKAVSKSDRSATEGLIVVATSEDHKKAAMIEINCETDFVAGNEVFVAFADSLAKTALDLATEDTQTLLAAKDGDVTFEETRQQLVLKLGENIQLRRINLIESEGRVSFYQHGRKIGVLVSISSDNDEVGKDIAMHIAAVSPKAISSDDLPKELVSKEKAVCEAQVKDLDKPADIIEKILHGKVSKALNEICLVGQSFVKDPSQTVADYLKSKNAQVTHFIRYEVGEGMEKKVENFAEEVRKQVEDK
ncbi:MAG: translation elongation factor Ts [Gammaproteobacteria bacterium]|nr:translation elongation factor Ts [Gammaproteobacteria bacterium]